MEWAGFCIIEKALILQGINVFKPLNRNVVLTKHIVMVYNYRRNVSTFTAFLRISP